MKPSYALIDYDNIKLVRKESTEADAEHSLEFIRNAVSKTCKKMSSEESRIRIYGGWKDENGQYTARANRLLRCMSKYGGLVNKVRIKIELAERLLSSSENLVCLFNSMRKEQKMVDTMIAVDAIRHYQSHNIIIMSNDEDIIPPVLSIKSHQNNSIAVIIRRDLKRQFNIDSFCKSGLLVEEA